MQNSPHPDGDAVVELTGVPSLLEKARAQLEQHLISFLQSPPLLAEPELCLSREKDEVVHVFVDNSGQ